MGKTLYVDNLGDSVSLMELPDWFTPFGTVKTAQVVTDEWHVDFSYHVRAN